MCRSFKATQRYKFVTEFAICLIDTICLIEHKQEIYITFIINAKNKEKGENMKKITDFISRLITAIFSDKPQEDENPIFKESYVVKRNSRNIIFKIILLLAVILGFFIADSIIGQNTLTLFYIFSAVASLLIIMQLYALLYKCRVTQNEIVCSAFFVFKKKILWQDIACVRRVDFENQKMGIITLYNKKGKCVLNVEIEMINARQLISTAKNNGIEVRAEKNLTAKQVQSLNN